MQEKVFLDKRIVDQQWCIMSRGEEEPVRGMVLTIEIGNEVATVLISAEELKKAYENVDLPMNEQC